MLRQSFSFWKLITMNVKPTIYKTMKKQLIFSFVVIVDEKWKADLHWFCYKRDSEINEHLNLARGMCHPHYLIFMFSSYNLPIAWRFPTCLYNCKGKKVLAIPEHCGIIKRVSATANGNQRMKVCYMEDIMVTYEVDIGKINVKFMKPRVSLEAGDNSIHLGLLTRLVART